MKTEGRPSADRFEFSKTRLQAHPTPRHGRTVVYDTKIPKLACRITQRGSRTLWLITRVRGKMEWVPIGPLSDVSIEQARKRAAKMLGEFAEGKNPAEARREAKTEITAGEAFEAYLKDRQARGIKRILDLRQLWERCLGELPAEAVKKKHGRMRTKHRAGVNWQDTKVSAITPDKVKSLHVAIGKRNPIQANRVIEVLSAMFNYLGVANPASEIEPFKETKRERFLQAAELPRFFAALAEDKSEDFRHFVTISLLTGARSANVCGMRWTDIDLDRGVWTIRATESKTSEAMHVALIEDVIALLNLRRRARPTSEFVFPAASASGHMVRPKKRWKQLLDRVELKELTARMVAADKPFDKWKNDGSESLERALDRLRRATEESKVSTLGARLEDVRLHDLRRSLGSWQAVLGSSLPIIGKSLGHKHPSTTAVYARLQMDPVRASVEAAAKAMLTAGGVYRASSRPIRSRRPIRSKSTKTTD